MPTCGISTEEVVCGRSGELGVALFEYLFQVPANRIGYTEYNLGQLKILQEVITLTCSFPSRSFTCTNR
jgi:uncharacterized protein (DUF486 family)